MTHSERIQAIADDLEAMIDQNDLQTVLEALEQVCHDKAEHLLVNWQDQPGYRSWTHCAKVAAKAAEHARRTFG